MRHDYNIAIVGAGLGGLTTAILLQRAGYKVVLYEQAAALARVGAGIHLGPNVMRIMRNLDLEQKLLRTALVPERRRSRDGYTGKLLAEIVTADLERRYGATHVILHRGDLIDGLASGVTEGSIRLGKRLTALSQSVSQACLHFEDGTTATADVVIGADGINSRVREIILGPERPIYSGHVAYRSIFPTDLLDGFEVDESTKWWGDDRNIIIYYLTKSKRELYFVTGVPEVEWAADNYAPQIADMDRVRAAFADFYPTVEKVLSACPNATCWPILERDEGTVWSRGNIVLLGDACHPMRPHLGQGAAMAMEDGVMIARCLLYTNDITDAFALYEHNRASRTGLMQRESRVNSPEQYGANHDWIHAYDVATVPLDTDIHVKSEV